MATAVASNGRGGDAVKFERLPESCRPIHYDIDIAPNMAGDFRFTGSVNIELKTVEQLSAFKLNACNLDIAKAKFVPITEGLKEQCELVTTLDAKRETATVALANALPSGTHGRLCIEYSGTHDTSMTGFYRSSYKDAEGKEHTFLSTQFESTYARKAFPCWDEPVYKATFDISLQCDSGMSALSNMSHCSTEHVDGGRRIVRYNRTPVMSTYLVAFAVGDMHCIESHTDDGVLVRVYVVGDKDKLKWCHYAMEVAKKSLTYYNEFFDIKYPLDKCDLIGIPDFSMGAMENWGLVTFREVELLYDPVKTSAAHKTRMTLVIAHELAHMWFGNLTTMRWWCDLWLKEGFATFMEYLCTDAHYPEYKVWMTAINNDTCRALGLDALNNSHPIEMEIEDPNQLDEVYDAITYCKANAVLRMLYMFIGHEPFQTGIRDYLDKFKYANTVPSDLWSAFGRASNRDIGTMMSTWTKHMGFPLLNVTMQQVESEDKRVVKISQSRFLADGTPDSGSHVWHVPITFTTGRSASEPVSKLLMTGRSEQVTVDNVRSDDWLKLNMSMSGFYRVQYDSGALDAMLPALGRASMPPIDRFNVLNDTFALVRSGHTTAERFLSMVAACHSAECELLVWQEIDSGIGALLNVMHAGSGSAHEQLHTFIQRIYTPIADKLTWTKAGGDEPFRTGMLRARVLSRLANTGHNATLEEARRMLHSRLHNGTSIDGDLMRTVYYSVARNGGLAEFAQVCTVLQSTDFPEEQRVCIASLAASKQHEVVAKALDYAMNSGHVRAQDLVWALASAAGTAVGQRELWAFFKRNWHALADKYGGPEKSLFISTLQVCSEYNSSESVAVDVEEFMRPHMEQYACLRRPTKQAVEEIRLNAKLLANNQLPVTKWLTDNGY